MLIKNTNIQTAGCMVHSNVRLRIYYRHPQSDVGKTSPFLRSTYTLYVDLLVGLINQFIGEPGK